MIVERKTEQTEKRKEKKKEKMEISRFRMKSFVLLFLIFFFFRSLLTTHTNRRRIRHAAQRMNRGERDKIEETERNLKETDDNKKLKLNLTEENWFCVFRVI